MSEPSLAFTPAVAAADWETASELWAYRASYDAIGGTDITALFDAWNTWAATSGTADEQAIATSHSPYGLTLYLSVAGLPNIASTFASNGLFTNQNGWFTCGNGVCLRDTFYGNGGWCYFYWADECDGVVQDPPVYTDPATNERIEVFSLTDVEFDNYIVNPSSTFTNGF